MPLLAPLGSELLTLAHIGLDFSPDEEAIESYSTFEENALAKARAFHARTTLPCIADDSGLSVDALGGQPGVLSKRWSRRFDLEGEALDAANNVLLLDALRAANDAGAEGRGARFVCAAAYADGERELVKRGETLGFVIEEGRGKDGFGYDPYFWSPELGKTFAEASIAEKAVVSHRGRAMRALCQAMKDL